MRRAVYILTLVLILLTVVAPTNATTETKEVEHEITIIEKTVCFNVSITDIYNKTSSKTICVVVDFYIMNAEPKNASIVVDFPLTIHVGNRTISQVVKVPLKVRGEVTKIIVKGVKEGGVEENAENVIWVVPRKEKTKTSIHVTTTPRTSKTSTTSKPLSTPKPVTVTKTVTKVVTSKQPSINVNDIVPYMLIVAAAVVGVILWKTRRPREVKEEKREERESIQDYIETLKLLKQKLEEKEHEIEKLKKTFPYKIMCRSCNNLVSPVITDDNRLLCPICRVEIGRVTPDGRLELTYSNVGEKGGEHKSSQNEVREAQGENNQDAERTRRKTGETVKWQGKLSDIPTED